MNLISKSYQSIPLQERAFSSLTATQGLRTWTGLLALCAAVLMGGGASYGAESAPAATVYKNPQCGCCEEYVGYLRNHGFEVKAIDTPDLSSIKRQIGVPARFEGCHTTVIEGYVIEGHVPVGTIERLLTERPGIKGISLPGMPEGSPGMSGQKTAPFVIYEISDDTPRVYATE